MTIVKGVTKTKVDSIKSKIVSGAEMDSFGTMRFIREDGSKITIGSFLTDSVPDSKSIVSRYSLVIPEWFSPKRKNDDVSSLSSGFDSVINSIKFSPDCSSGIVLTADGPYLSVFSRKNDVLQIESSPATTIPGVGGTATWRSDGLFVTIVDSNNSKYTTYTKSGSYSLVKVDGMSGDAGVQSSIQSKISAIDWSPDGKYLILGGRYVDDAPYLSIYRQDGNFLFYNSSSNLPLGEPASTLVDSLWSPDGRFIASMTAEVDGVNGTLKFHKFVSDSDLDEIPHQQIPYLESSRIKWSADGYLIATSKTGTTGYVFKYNETTNQFDLFSETTEFPSYSVTELMISPDAKYIYTLISETNELILYRFRDGKIKKLLKTVLSSAYTQLCGDWTADGRHIFIGTSGATSNVTVLKSSMIQPKGSASQLK